MPVCPPAKRVQDHRVPVLTVSPGDLEAASWPMLWTASWPVSQSPAGNSGDLPKAYEKELTEVRTVT